MPAKWSTKFLLKGKSKSWVFVPTPESAALGRQIKQEIESCWTAPDYYFHLKKGGHVKAISAHLGECFYLHLDIKNFFGSISRARVTRSLKKLLGYRKAREYAEISTVYQPHQKEGKTILPFGFIQSQLLASVCLKNSALGKCLDQIAHSPDFVVSVYVDDIIVSSSDMAKLNECLALLYHSAFVSLFSFNEEKTEGPGNRIIAFNIKLENQFLSIEQDKLDTFKQRCKSAQSLAEKMGVVGYVHSVNTTQADEIVDYVTSV